MLAASLLTVPPYSPSGPFQSKSALPSLSSPFCPLGLVAFASPRPSHQFTLSLVASRTTADHPTSTTVMAATLEAAHDAIVANVPLGRIGSPDDVAGACIFLSSKAGQWVNG